MHLTKRCVARLERRFAVNAVCDGHSAANTSNEVPVDGMLQFVVKGVMAMWRLRGVRWLLSPAAGPEASNVIRWWESRRPIYNLLMLGIGGGNLLLFFLVLTAERLCFPTLFATPAHPVLVFIQSAPFPVLLAALGANAIYTFGWVAELAVRRLWRPSAARFGPAAWVCGTTFSVIISFSLLIMNVIGCAVLYKSQHPGGA
jgi:hypothetical protein